MPDIVITSVVNTPSDEIVNRTADNELTGTNKFGSATSYTQLSDDGTLTQVGDATTFEDLVFEMTPVRINPATSKPDFDYTNIGFLMPQNDATEIIYIIVQLPHKWKQGSTIYPHCHVIQSANQQAVMKLDYRWINIGADSTVAFTTGYTMGTYATTYSSGSIHQILKGSGISGSGKTMSSILEIKLYRDDNVYTGICF